MEQQHAARAAIVTCSTSSTDHSAAEGGAARRGARRVARARRQGQRSSYGRRPGLLRPAAPSPAAPVPAPGHGWRGAGAGAGAGAGGDTGQGRVLPAAASGRVPVGVSVPVLSSCVPLCAGTCRSWQQDLGLNLLFDMLSGICQGMSWQHLHQPQGWKGVIPLSLSLWASTSTWRTCSRTTSYQGNGIVASGKSSLAYPRGP